MHLFNIALAPALLLLFTTPTATAPTPPPAKINLYVVIACGSASGIGTGSVTVDPSAKIVDLPNNQCVPTPNTITPRVPYTSFRSYVTASAPAGASCFTTVYSDAACLKPVVTALIGQQDGNVCYEALPPTLQSSSHLLLPTQSPLCGLFSHVVIHSLPVPSRRRSTARGVQ